MSIILRAFGLLTITVISASALTEEKVNETRTAKAGGKLIVDVDFGTIEVVVGDNDKVVLAGYRKIDASSKEKEQEYLAAAPITITADGNDVTVRARREKKGDDLKSWSWHGHSNMDAHYRLSVPAAFNANLKTAGGDISAKNLTGTIKADTSGGDLAFDRVHGPINAHSSGGQIEVTACEGAIDVETSGGRIEARGGSGSLNARTSGEYHHRKRFRRQHKGGDERWQTRSGKHRWQTGRRNIRWLNFRGPCIASSRRRHSENFRGIDQSGYSVECGSRCGCRDERR